MKELDKIEKWKNLTSFDLLTLNLTFKVKCHFVNRVILKAWPILILSGMVASFEHKMPSTVFSRAWIVRVLAAEATKAGSASEDTRLMPRPPSLTSRLAWIHWLSERSQLVMRFINIILLWLLVSVSASVLLVTAQHSEAYRKMGRMQVLYSWAWLK